MITQATCLSYKRELFQGVHLESDVYKIALYTAAAALSKATTVYTATNEVVGAGYTAGGRILGGFTAGLDGDTAYLDFADATWPASTITARGALIYNTSRGNKALAVLDFGADVISTNGLFTVPFPVPSAMTALLRID